MVNEHMNKRIFMNDPNERSRITIYSQHIKLIIKFIKENYESADLEKCIDFEIFNR